jgi:hypothetical protein
MHATRVCESLGILFICGNTLLEAALPPGTREALAEFETGARKPTRCASDFAVGSRKEISRFQILPSVWREYSRTNNFHDPKAAWAITAKILRDREADFRQATGRDWDGVDLYLMWNAPGSYRRARWDRARVSRVVRERAERFDALLQEHQRLRSEQTLAKN